MSNNTNERFLNAQEAVGARRALSKPFLVNNSNTTIYYKPEKNVNAAIPLAPGKSSYAAFDGVATHLKCDEVFKVRDGATAVVDKKGNVEVGWSRGGPLVPHVPLLGGWKGGDFLKEHPDWSELFDVAKNICIPNQPSPYEEDRRRY